MRSNFRQTVRDKDRDVATCFVSPFFVTKKKRMNAIDSNNSSFPNWRICLQLLSSAAGIKDEWILLLFKWKVHAEVFVKLWQSKQNGKTIEHQQSREKCELLIYTNAIGVICLARFDFWHLCAWAMCIRIVRFGVLSLSLFPDRSIDVTNFSDFYQ